VGVREELKGKGSRERELLGSRKQELRGFRRQGSGFRNGP
jgi:hypothetical protein